MIVRIRLKVPFGSRAEAAAMDGAPAVPVTPPRFPVEIAETPFPQTPPDPGETLLRLNDQLAAYEMPAPVNVTVHEAAVTNLVPPDAPNN